LIRGGDLWAKLLVRDLQPKAGGPRDQARASKRGPQVGGTGRNNSQCCQGNQTLVTRWGQPSDLAKLGADAPLPLVGRRQGP